MKATMGSSNKQLFILFEAASGYALFEVVESEHIALQTSEVQSAMNDLSRFSKIVKMKAFNVSTAGCQKVLIGNLGPF